MADRFTPEVEATLRDAGWTPGRQLSRDAVAAMHQAVAAGRGRYDGRLTSAYLADPVLAEFGGLVIAGDGAGVDLNPRPFAIDPALAAQKVETLIDVGRAMGVTLYPLGVEGMDEAVLALTDQGKVVSIDPVGEWFLGDTFDEALDTLVTGRLPRPVGPGDGRAPQWLAPPENSADNLPLGAVKHPVGAAFFLPRTPLNLPYVWLPDTLLRMGIVPLSSQVDPGRFEVGDWGGVRCEVHVLDLDSYTVLVLAFDQYDFLDQRAETTTADGEGGSRVDGTPVARAFHNACAGLTPDLEMAFLHVHRTPDLLRFVAEQELDAVTLDGHALLDRGFGMLYLTERVDFEVAATLETWPRDELPISGGRLVLAGKRPD
jgi:hypothetical protein